MVEHKSLGKVLLILFLSLTSFGALGQKGYNGEAHLRDLLAFRNIALDSLWEFGYLNKDSSFQVLEKNVNTETLQNNLGKEISWNGSGWFQKSFSLPDTLQGKPIFFWILHLGASEVYLDGKLVRRFGKFQTQNQKNEYYISLNPEVILPQKQTRHTWRVHFLTPPIKKVIEGDIIKGFFLVMASNNLSRTEKILGLNPELISFGLIFSFFLFFLFVYIFYPHRTASLFTALFLLDFSFVFLSISLNTISTNETSFFIMTIWWKTSVISLNYLYLLTVYSLYYKNLPKIYWFIGIFMVLSIVFVWVLPNFFNLAPVLLLALWLETIRILILGIRKKIPGFWILAIGHLLTMFFFFVFIANVFHAFDIQHYNPVWDIGRFIANLVNPLTFSLQLAWEFGASNRTLKTKLEEVEVLSVENIKQEKEKQHILANHNEILEKQVEERTRSLQSSLEKLKTTQNQLIQSEKMASLGELTAGIAHEIQNPLNFVNNFSEVNRELLEEVKYEIRAGKTNEAFILLDSLSQNEEKIHFHGKRADSIVKGMLNHSRTRSGSQELIQINILVDEYLRLAFQSFRAKDKSFNAEIETSYENDLPPILSYPQDLGRVILNLIYNALYTINEKSKSLQESFQPTLKVTTQKKDKSVVISIQDNGNGIAEKIQKKIFQPFFTTKPTGEGTGLGLSISYDIIKTLKGEITFRSEWGVGSEFTLHLPLIKGKPSFV